MSSVTADMEIKSYIAALERELDDLPDDDRRELLEDLEQHLTEVAAEGDGSLHDRLGSPQSYAAELRASAGLPPRNASRPKRIVERLIRPLHTPAIRAVWDFLPELRPGWWVLRGYLGALALDALVDSHVRSGFTLLPRFGFSQLTGLGIVGLAIFVSVQLGRASRQSLFRWVSIAANIAGVLTFLWMLSYPPAQAYEASSFEGPYFNGVLAHPDGSEITNICVYDSKLKPLKNALLFDQDGRPIANVAPMPELFDQYGNLIAQVPDARTFANQFPRPMKVVADPNTMKAKTFKCPELNRSR